MSNAPATSERTESIPAVDVKSLYPSRAALLRHVALSIVRIATLCTLGVYLLYSPVQRLHGYLGWSDSTFLLTMGMGLHSALVWSYIAFFAACDRFGWFKKYKLPRTKRMASRPGLVTKAMIHTVLYHGVFRVLLGCGLCYLFPYPPITTPLDPLWETWIGFGLMVIAGEVVVYWVHRMQHELPWLYRLHKKHHEFFATEVVTTEYSDPVELVLYGFLNYTSTSHKPMVVHFVVIAWKLTETLEEHCGYSFQGTWLHSKLGMLGGYRAAFHDFHHSHNRGTYGMNLFLDYWLGTCDEFLLHQHKLGRTPIAY